MNRRIKKEKSNSLFSFPHLSKQSTIDHHIYMSKECENVQIQADVYTIQESMHACMPGNHIDTREDNRNNNMYYRCSSLY